MGTVLAALRRAVTGELRQPDSDRPGRDACQRISHRAGGGSARILRTPQSAAPRPAPNARGYLGKDRIHPVAQVDRPPVQWPNQGTIVFKGLCNVCFRHHQGYFQPVAEPERQRWGSHCATGHCQCTKEDEVSAQSSAQENHPRAGTARKTGGLHFPGPCMDRVVPGGRRLSRRLGETGQKTRIPGHSPAQGQDPQYLGSGV